MVLNVALGYLVKYREKNRIDEKKKKALCMSNF